MAKQLLIENCEIPFSRVLPIEEKNKLEESLKISKKANDCLLVKDVVCTILDRKNQNGRTYTTKIMQQAIDEARPQMAAKMLVCSGNEHPVETSSVEPKYISHYISDARIRNVELIVEGKKERHNVLFCDFYVLPTDPYGKNLQRFILEGVGTGISIRGLGDCDANGNVVDYQLLGADIVSNPSSSVYLSTPVTESVSIKPADKLEETFIVSASSTNVTRDLDQAAQLQAEIENKKYGTLAKTSMKVDSEVDPKTGAETTLVTLETETEDETSDLDQALMMAKRAILNGAADIDSVTIENVKEEQPKESVKNSDVPLNEDAWKDDENLFKTLYRLKDGNIEKDGTQFEFIPLDDKTVKVITTTQTNKSDGSIESLVGEETVPYEKARTYWHKLQASGLYDFDDTERTMKENSNENPHIQHIMNNIDKLSDVQLKRFNELKTNFENGIIDEEDIKVFANSCGLPALDDEEQYGSCAWCGDVLPMSDLKKEKDLGYVCNHCARGLASREGELDFEESDDENDPMYKALDKSNYYAFKEPEEYIKFISANKDFLGDYDFSEAEQILNDYKVGTLNKALTRHKLEPFVSIIRHNYQARNFDEGVYVPESEMSKEQAITEAKEESPNAGKKFVLKCPAGFAAMDGNALVFKANPKEALHFVDGKEETGLVHLSEVEKILDAMGVYDREKYYRKDITDISAKPAEEAVVQNKGENQDVIKEGNNEGMNTSVPAGTQFEAIVKVVGQNGESTDTIPVSATEYDSIIKEVGNLYDMKSQNADGELSITLKEPATGKEYMYNPETRNLDSIENEMPTPLPESAGDVEQDGAKLSMEIDDTDKVEKEFDSPAQASVVKAGLEQGKLPGDVMLSEDEQKPDWKIGVVFNHLEYGEGIYNNADPTSGQTVFNGKIPEKVRVYLYPEELGVTTIDDLMVTDEGIAKVEELAREKLSDKVDATGDIYTVREFKRDEYPEVPGIFDTEKELVEAERPQYQDAPDYGNQNIQPGWYAGAMNIGVTGPYESEEALRTDLGDIADKVQIEYISPEELGLAAESTSMDEVLFNKPSEASDPEVKKPMTDAVEQDIMVTVNNVDWNTNDLINMYMNNMQDDDVVSFGDIQSKINDLPNELDIKMTKEELPEDVNLDTLKELVKNKVAKEYAMNVNDLDIKDLNSIN